MEKEVKKKDVSRETILPGGPIYEEDIKAVLICLDKALKLHQQDKVKYKDVTTHDILIQHGYQIVSKNSQLIEDVINIRSFIPRYMRIMKQAKKSSKEMLRTKKIINDFISKFKINRIN